MVRLRTPPKGLVRKERERENEDVKRGGHKNDITTTLVAKHGFNFTWLYQAVALGQQVPLLYPWS